MNDFRQVWNGQPENWLVRWFGADTVETRMCVIGLIVWVLLLGAIGLGII